MNQHEAQPGVAGPFNPAAGGIMPNPMLMQYPLKDISVPHPHDVLCGRGS